MQHVFVYGTLCRGERYAAVAEQRGQPLRRHAYVQGFVLYGLEPEQYPALLPASLRCPANEPEKNRAHRIWGECLSYAPEHWPAALALLDDLEDVHEQPPLYTREQTSIYLTEPSSGACDMLSGFVYVYARPERLKQRGAKLIVGGDWRNR